LGGLSIPQTNKMNREEVKEFLNSKPGYLKFGRKKLSEMLDADISVCKAVLKELRYMEEETTEIVSKKIEAEVSAIKSNRKEIFKNAFTSQDLQDLPIIEVRKNKVGKNVLVIGDLHEPFCLRIYLQHCIETYIKYKCDEVIFIGDIIDNHASSYHETDPDGHSAGLELKLAIQNIKAWYKAFPKATVIIGNHDRLIMRKAQTSGLSKLWIKGYAEVLGTPGWDFVGSIEIDNVLYIHGEGGTARMRARRDLQSVVQGHLHSQAYIEWMVGTKFKIFGMQVGCGVDNKAYAMAYGKEYAKPAIACGVVLQGLVPINVMVNL
jgi:metallophosphoesterase superfamily enzyme